MASVGPAGWDAQGYWKAAQAVHHDSDPYAEDLVALQAFHTRLASNPAERPPFVYVYSPMTLPFLRLLAVFPRWLLGLLYWTAVATGVLLQLWAGFQMADQRERRWLALMLPAIIFFPGLITDDAILSGNVAYPLYGVILAAATAGWKHGRWSWYYIAVLAASIFKTPFLVFLAFPILMESGRDRDSDSDRGKRQWVPSATTAVIGVLIFAAQIRLWPGLFREYLSSLRLVFDYLHDFGYGPAGTVGRALWRRGLPSALATTILHLLVVCALAVVLLFLARRVREWKLPREAWVPVALVGTALLNPRIMKYDLAAITIPMLLIGGRALRFALGRSVGERAGESQAANSHVIGQKRSDITLILVASGCFLIPNVITVAGPFWFPVEAVVLLAIFAMGVWLLDQSSQVKVFNKTCRTVELGFAEN